MLAAFLFIIYLGLACFFITKVGLVKNAGLTVKTILFLFLARIGAAVVLGMVNHFLLHNYSDYDSYNQFGMLEYQTLFSDPHKFFTDLFVSNYNDTGEFFGSSHSYWNDLRTNIIFKLIGITDIFSRGNYFVNSIFFNFFAFIANVALYRVFIHIYPTKKTAVIIGSFLLPSCLYFSSGIHKDLFVFAGLCFFCYYLYFSLEDRFTVKRTAGILLSFLLILFIRNFIAVLLVPAVLAWIISKRYQGKAAVYYVYAAVAGICVTGALSAHYLSPGKDPLQVIIQKQQSFLTINKANTQFGDIDTLQPTISSFISAAPAAVRHAYFSPLPLEFSVYHMYLFAAEMICYWLLFLLMIFYRSAERTASFYTVLFGYFFSFLVLFFTGYISTAAGALIRYRSIYIPFIIVPILCSVDWKRFRQKLFSKK